MTNKLMVTIIANPRKPDESKEYIYIFDEFSEIKYFIKVK